MQRGSPNFESLKNALQHERWDDIPKSLTVSKILESWSQGEFKVDGERASYKGKPLPDELSRRITGLIAANESPTIIFNFWERLQKNPSYRSVNQLWSFLKNANIPLTPDGCFLAYKSVRTDYRDHHSGKFDNSPGTVNEMPRNEISDDQRQACDPGFHVGAMGYVDANYHNGRVVICKVDPKDVVSVPDDYSSQKMRVCRYEVVGHHGESLPSTVFAEDHRFETSKEESHDSETDESDEIEDEEDENETGVEEEEDDDLKEDVVEEALTALEEKGLVEKIGTATSTPRAPKKRKKEFHGLDAMGTVELLEQSLDTLRHYAYKGLEIVGATKIAGGKTALVATILRVRGDA